MLLSLVLNFDNRIFVFQLGVPDSHPMDTSVKVGLFGLIQKLLVHGG